MPILLCCVKSVVLLQASKAYARECVPIDIKSGEKPIVLEDYPGSTRKPIVILMKPGPTYYANREAAASNATPQRHKFPKETSDQKRKSKKEQKDKTESRKKAKTDKTEESKEEQQD